MRNVRNRQKYGNNAGASDPNERMIKGLRLVVSRSRTTISRTPRFARLYATLAPMIPPPTTPTSGIRDGLGALPMHLPAALSLVSTDCHHGDGQSPIVSGETDHTNSRPNAARCSRSLEAEGELPKAT